jgi:hypothetical protein
VTFLVCRRRRLENWSVMEDARDRSKESLGDSIQETGHEQQPARMVGYFSLESVQSSKEAGRDKRVRLLRREGEKR